MDFLKGGLWPMGDYPNLLGITPADRRPKLRGLRAETYILDEAPMAYNVDLGDPFGEKTVYVKTPMRLEDFDMSLCEDLIRSNTQFYTIKDPLTKDLKITASFELSNGTEFKVEGHISHFVASVEEDALQNMKNKLTDILVHKVKTYYEGKVVKEEKKMMVYIPGMNKDVSESLINELFKISYKVDVQYDVLAYATNPSGVLKLDIPFENVSRLRVSAPMDKNHWLEGIPAVKKVETYNQRVVKVTFIDDTFTKSVCSENDHFDIDVGITICLLKRFVGSNGDDATRNYNKLMNQVHAVMEKNEKERLARVEEEKTLKAKRRKIELKRAAKKLKAKEDQIDIQKQAIIRAHQEMEGLEQ